MSLPAEIVLIAAIAFGLIVGALINSIMNFFERVLPKNTLSILKVCTEVFTKIFIVLVIFIVIWGVFSDSNEPTHPNNIDERQGPFYRGDEY